MIKAQIKVDRSLFEKKMNVGLVKKVIPYARIQAAQIAKYGLKAVRLFTLRTKSRHDRTAGRIKIANLWQLTHSRKSYMDLYTIKNLYPNQDVLVFFEEGTEPHEIRPKRKSILHWQDPDSGKDIFARLVHNPGIEETRMVERAEREVIQPRVNDWINKTMQMTDREMR